MRTLALYFVCSILMVFPKWGASVHAAEDPGVSYYLEDANSAPGPWRVSAGMATGVSDPYLSFQSETLRLERELGRYLIVGAQGSVFQAQSNGALDALSQPLQQEGGSVHVARPERSFFASVGTTPLSGKLLFFKGYALDLDLTFRAGIGEFFEEGPGSMAALMWAVSPSARVWKNIYLDLEVRQEIAGPFSANHSVARLMAGTGLSLRL